MSDSRPQGLSEHINISLNVTPKEYNAMCDLMTRATVSTPNDNTKHNMPQRPVEGGCPTCQSKLAPSGRCIYCHHYSSVQPTTIFTSRAYSKPSAFKPTQMVIEEVSSTAPQVQMPTPLHTPNVAANTSLPAFTSFANSNSATFNSIANATTSSQFMDMPSSSTFAQVNTASSPSPIGVTRPVFVNPAPTQHLPPSSPTAAPPMVEEKRPNPERNPHETKAPTPQRSTATPPNAVHRFRDAFLAAQRNTPAKSAKKVPRFSKEYLVKEAIAALHTIDANGDERSTLAKVVDKLSKIEQKIAATPNDAALREKRKSLVNLKSALDYLEELSEDWTLKQPLRSYARRYMKIRPTVNQDDSESVMAEQESESH
jgi:hypothetical protein